MKTKIFFRICLFLAASTLALQAGPKRIERWPTEENVSLADPEQNTEQQRRLTEIGDHGEATENDEQKNNRITAKDQIDSYYQQYKRRLDPNWHNSKSNERIWFERAVEENNLGDIDAAVSALKIAKVWGNAQKNNTIFRKNKNYQNFLFYYDTGRSLVPPCVARFFLLTESERACYHQAQDDIKRAKALEKAFESREQNDEDLDYTEKNIPIHIKRAQKALQAWKEKPIPDSVEEQQLFLQHAEDGIIFWEAKRNWCRNLSEQEAEWIYQEKLNQLADACDQVKEIIEQRLFPFQLDEELIYQMQLECRKKQSNLNIPYIPYSRRNSFDWLERWVFVNLLPINFDDYAQTKQVADAYYHQENQRTLWMKLPREDRLAYNSLVLRKNDEYHKAVELQIKRIKKVRSQLNQAKQEYTYKYKRPFFPCWIDNAAQKSLEKNIRSLEKSEKDECDKLLAKHVLLQLAKKTPQDRDAWVQKQYDDYSFTEDVATKLINRLDWPYSPFDIQREEVFDFEFHPDPLPDSVFD